MFIYVIRGFAKRRPAARRPTAHGPRPAARGPPHGPRPDGPTARRPTSRPAARGPQIFGQWYIKAHAQIGIGECGRLWSKMDDGEFLVSSQLISIILILCNPCISLMLFAQGTYFYVAYEYVLLYRGLAHRILSFVNTADVRPTTM